MDIYQLIATKKKQRSSELLRAANPSTDPRDAHGCEVSARTLQGEIETLEVTANENETLIPLIENLIDKLNAFKTKTANRTLAMRHLEDASMRLRRETGNPIS